MSRNEIRMKNGKRESMPSVQVVRRLPIAAKGIKLIVVNSKLCRSDRLDRRQRGCGNARTMLPARRGADVDWTLSDGARA
ncbi:hypothetical protein CF651_14870 [Paenibacillus rigui]|uniref:Uncharacterized protein n=1 Tax=Paenibacillus rigui TaxID=554312 RepID=A0A229URW5_9BACL|nr:hypothetical protein CF651_14870 [Paenibacillus rigui]